MKLQIKIIAVLLLLLILLTAVAGCITPTSQSSSSNTSNITMLPIVTNANGVNSAISKSKHGLSLSLTLLTSTYQPGQEVTIVINEYNTLSTTNNIPASNKWPLKGLNLDPCNPLSATLGVALFQGYYSFSDLFTATPLVIFAPSKVHCPIEYIPVSYSFKPSSDIANIAIDSDPPSKLKEQQIRADITIEGYWNTSDVNASFINLSPGVYTIVGGDEWGALAVLHFTVSVPS
jgi:hypothetical protein